MNFDAELKAMLRRVQQGGGRTVDVFVDDVFDLALQHGMVVIDGLGDDAARVERTTKAYFRLQAAELLSGKHNAVDWLHVKSQWSSQALIAAVIVHAQVLGFVANVFRAALGVFGGAGNYVVNAGLDTVAGLLGRLK